MKASNLTKVIQMITKHDPVDHFDAESRIAGMSSIPGFISAAAVASKFGSDEVDQIISYHEISPFNTGDLPTGMRYALVDLRPINDLRAEQERLQAKIDALMLEYCPEEMTPE